MGRWIHRLSSIDADRRTGNCAECGPVLLKKTTHGWRCAVAADKDHSESNSLATIWRRANRDDAAAVRRVRYSENREKALADGAVWRAANPEKIRIRAAAYRRANPEKIKAAHAAWRASGGRRSDWRTPPMSSEERCEASEWMQIIANDPCAYCGEPMEHVDHIQAISRGGDGLWTNMTASCARCNTSKWAKPPSKVSP